MLAPGMAIFARRILRAAPLLTLLAALGSCSDFLAEPAPPAPGALAISFSVVGDPPPTGTGEAFDKADRVRVRIARQGAPSVDIDRPFASAGAETRLSVNLESVQDNESARVSLELLRGAAVLFTGEATATLKAGGTTQASVPLSAVPGAVQILTKPVPELTSLGATAQLRATASFATGDPLPGLTLSWSSSNPAIADVDAQGLVTARAEGEAVIRASHQGLSDQVPVRVRQVVAALRVSPPSGSVEVGRTLQLVTVLLDARGSLIQGRAVSSWVSANPAVATVSSTGLVTGVTPGPVTITASHEGHSGASSLMVVARPRIALSPATLYFDATQGTDPAPQTVSVTNGGSGTLSGLSVAGIQYDAGASGWLSASLSTTGAPATLTLQASVGTLQPNTYGATVLVGSSVAENSPQQVRVSFRVGAGPRIELSPTSVVFHAPQNGPLPTPQTVSVTNGGGGTLSGVAAGQIAYGGGAGGWLSASLNTSAAPATLSLQVTTTNLQPGTTYTAQVPVTSAAALNSPQVVNVSFTVGAGPRIVLDPTALHFTSTQGGANPAPQAFGVSNGGGGVLSGLGGSIQYAPGEPTGWLSGSLSGTTAPATATMRATTGTLQPGVYSATVFIMSPVASNSPQAVAVTFTITPPTDVPFMLINRANTSHCMEAIDQPVHGTQLRLGPCLGRSIELFTFSAAGELRFRDWCVDAATGGGNDGDAIILWSCHAGANQQWRLTTEGELRGIQNKCIGTQSGSSAVGTPLVLSTCAGQLHQRWQLQAASGARIALNPTSVSFSATRNGAIPPWQVVVVANGGSGTLAGLGVSSITYGSGASGWLSANMSGTTAPTTLVVQPTTTNLQPGTYTAQVWIAAQGAINSPQTVSVTYSVAAVPAGGWVVMNSGTLEQLSAVWGTSATNVFAVGDFGTILHYDGGRWSAMNSGTTNWLHGVWGTSASNVFAVGEGGTILHYNGSSWSAMNSGTTSFLFGVWGTSAADIYAVGYGGMILHYNGSTWSVMNSGTTASLWGVWGTWAVGNSGTIRRNDGSTWSHTNSGTSATLYAVWGYSFREIFTVGSYGTIGYFNGSTWSYMNSGTARRLNGVWGTSATNVYAVGNEGTILHYNGSTWSAMNSGTWEQLSAVWGTSATNIFAVGLNGAILRYTGN
jgi:hypothetical protein